MKYSGQNLLVDYSTMVETIRLSEQTRNFDDAVLAFQNIWSDFDIDPDYSGFPPHQQAELFRLSGYFLSNYGKIKNRINYQERGKNLLTKAIEIYSDFSDFVKVAEAQNALAICYFFEGAILESEIILEQTAKDFLPDHLHLVYLQNRGNLLKTKIQRKKYKEALEIIEEIEVPMEFCEDKRTCIVYYENSGIVFRRTAQYEKAIWHYQKAIALAKEINSYLFIGQANNNLAFLYNQIGNFDLAHLHSDIAIEIAQEQNQIGTLPHIFDTKALIYFEEGNFNAALTTINEAISIFQNGEDAGGLTEALWNKCKFLLYLNRKEEAIKLFTELAPIAAGRMGEYAVDNFAGEFAELIHIKRNGSLEEETKRFRRVEVITAIRKAKYEMKAAAESLKITLDELTKIIDQEFPELLEEINIERFAALNKESKEITQPSQQDISELFLSNSVSNLSGQFSTFYFDTEIMKDVFAISQDVVMAIEQIKKITPDEHILVHDKLTGIYSFGKVQYDNIFDLYFLLDKGEPMPISLDEVNLVGKAVGYFPFNEIDNEKLEFKPFDF